MYFVHIYTYFPLTLFHIYLYLTTSCLLACVFVFHNNLFSPVCAAQILLGEGHLLECGWLTSSHSFEDNQFFLPRNLTAIEFFLPQNLTAIHSASVRGEVSWTPSSFFLGCLWSDVVQVFCRQLQLPWGHECPSIVTSPIHKNTIRICFCVYKMEILPKS